MLEKILENNDSSSLLIFPTKALAQDQLRSIQEYLELLSLPKEYAGCYDGDTSYAERKFIEKNARILLTNPDMLHCTILKNHIKFRKFFCNLDFIIVDESHFYSGIFGSHVSLIVKRFLRLCLYYQYLSQNISVISIVACSATIGNPQSHFMRLVTSVDDLELFTEDFSPKGEQLFCLWQPPIIPSSSQENKHRSANTETARICTTLIQTGISILVFTTSRKATETNPQIH